MAEIRTVRYGSAAFMTEHNKPPRIISLKVNNSDISRLRDARDTIAVGQQGQVLYLLVEP